MGKNFKRSSKTKRSNVNSNGNSRSSDNAIKGRGREFELDLPDKAVNIKDLNVLFNKRGKNDIAWAQNLPQMLKDVASLPFGNPAGLKFNTVQNKLTSFTIDDSSDYSVPGICVARFAATLGTSVQPNSALNLAAQQIYALDRAANSGAKNYDKTDVMLMIGGMDSAYIWYQTMLRAYRTLFLYDYMNRYLPDALLTAQGFSPASLRSELANFRYIINQFAYKIGSINVPDQFDFIKRHTWITSNIYKDADIDKAQFYMFVCDQLFIYQEGTDSKPSQLTATRLSSFIPAGQSLITIDIIEKICDAITAPLLGSEDIGTISGDLAKAFGENGMIKIMPIGENESIQPVYNEEVLHCFLNMDIKSSIIVGDITQDLTNLTAGPFLVTNNRYNGPLTPTSFAQSAELAADMMKHVMNINSDTPTPELSMTASRFMCVINPALDAESQVVSIPTEVVRWCTVYSLNADGSLQTWELSTNCITSVSLGGIAHIVSSFSKFDWHPRIMMFQGHSGNTGVTYLGDASDYYNYTVVEDSSIIDLNDVYIMSLFKVKDWRG